MIGYKNTESVNYTASATIAPNDLGKYHVNKGAAGTVVLTLPARANFGDHLFAFVDAVQVLRIAPVTGGKIYLAGVAGVANKGVEANAKGEIAKLVCIGGADWAVEYSTGTWTAEA